MATLQFKGKNIIWNHHLSVPYHTLDLDEKLTYNKETSNGNLIIEGDNLPALKSLLPQYSGKVNFVYIDPPYNTGNEKWIYNDNVNSPLIKEWLGVTVRPDDLSRHDKWLCFMTPRIKLIWELLTTDGVMFISIANDEIANLKVLLDELFGEDKFVTIIQVEMSTVQGQKVGSAKQGNLVKNGEYILVYSRNGQKNIGKQLLYDKSNYDPHYSLWYEVGMDEPKKLSEIILKNDTFKKLLLELGLIKKNGKSNSISSQTIAIAYETIPLIKSFINENAQNIYREHDTVDIKNPEKYKTAIFKYTTSDRDYLIINKGDNKYLQLISLSDKIRKADDFNSSYGPTTIRGDWWGEFYLDMGNIGKEGETNYENGKKPVRLIKQLLKFASNKSDLVLDAFAGSGTTAQAVLELNVEDKGDRKFILIQMPENNENEPNKNITKDITRERIIKVAENKLESKEIGFEYKRVGQPIDAETILSGQLPTYKELAKYVFYLATGQTPKDKDIDETKYLAGKVDHTEVYLIYKQDMDELKTLALTHDWAKKTSEGNENKKIVYAPACFMDDEYLDQFNIRFVSIPYNLFERQK